MTRHLQSILALGDSYTIGEGVPLHECFPYQAVQLLRKQNLGFYAPEIVAKTGWTSFELTEHVLQTTFNSHYDFVTLLIGVNNQYRNLLTTDYQNDFEYLLKKGIHLAGDNAERLLVLSIPDWGLSPYAESRDRQKIATEIAHFNDINKQLTQQYMAQYLDIGLPANSAVDPQRYTNDRLHPSPIEYRRWAIMVANAIISTLRID